MKIVHEIVQTAPRLPFKFYLHDELTRIAVSPHWHQGVEINMLVEGMPLKFVTDGVTHEYVPGDAWVVNSRSVHSATGYDNGGWREFGLIIDADFLTANYPDLGSIEFHLTGSESSSAYRELIHHLRDTMDLLTGPTGPAIRLSVLGHFYAVLGILFSHFTQAKIPTTVTENVGMVDNMMNSIVRHYAEPISGRTLAHEFHVSLTTVNSQFNDAIQMPISRYIRLVRLLNARKLLLATDQPVTVVAGACGFSSDKTLTRNFKRWKGMTPSAYRARFAQYH